MKTESVITKSDEQALREGAYYDPEQAERPIRFLAQYLRSKFIVGAVQLLDWQADIIRRLYGWRNKDGSIRHKRVIISTAKKNGKNLLGVAICLYELFGGTQPSPEVVSASTTAKNSEQIYRELCYCIEQNPKLQKLAKYRDSYREIRVASKHGKYRGFSSDSGAAEGENISCCLCDENHAHESDALFRSLEHAASARPSGILVCISTAGVDQSRAWYGLFDYALKVQKGEIVDTSILPAIFTTDPAADLDDPNVWHQANPSLGTSFTTTAFGKAWETAKQEGTASVLSFKRYRFNQWVAGEESYLDPAKFDQCISSITEDELAFAPLFVGVDLSQTTDPSSVGLCWSLPNRVFAIRSHSWVCELGVRRRELSNLPRYQQFAAEHDMTITPGEVIDTRRIKEYLFALRQNYNLRGIVFDAYNFIELAKELEASGIPVFKMPQSHKYFTSPLKEFECAITEKRIRHDGNKLLRWAFSNAKVDYDSYSNCKLDKQRSIDKIDPAVSTIMAFAYASHEQASMPQEESIYNKRPVTLI